MDISASPDSRRSRWLPPRRCDQAVTGSCRAQPTSPSASRWELSPLDVMLAVFGRANDPASGGRQTPGAFGSRAARLVMTSAAAAPHVVHAAAIAYATNVSGRDEVTLVCTDERGIQSGDWHEGIKCAGA